MYRQIFTACLAFTKFSVSQIEKWEGLVCSVSTCSNFSLFKSQLVLVSVCFSFCLFQFILVPIPACSSFCLFQFQLVSFSMFNFSLVPLIESLGSHKVDDWCSNVSKTLIQWLNFFWFLLFGDDQGSHANCLSASYCLIE